MYKKEEVFNIRNNDKYELTELDERIYNETGYVIHQVDYAFEYKQYFGSVYGQTIACIGKDGFISGQEWTITNDDNKDYEIVELPEKLMKLLKLKYEELMNGYWKENS